MNCPTTRACTFPILSLTDQLALATDSLARLTPVVDVTHSKPNFEIGSFLTRPIFWRGIIEHAKNDDQSEDYDHVRGRATRL